jgi:NSS family neurotransmitter:Na+ symporter
MASRGAFNSRIGFLMAAVGSAVGLGNLWRFPYIVSQNGGAVFLFLYLIFLFLIGIPALMAELSIGRARQRNSVDAFEIDRKGRKYSWIGFVFLGTSVALLSYYSVIAGWAVAYAAEAVIQPIQQMAPGFFGGAGQAESWFTELALSSSAIWFHLIFMTLTVAILIRGVSKGIEAANLIMMPLLFAFVIGLAIYGGLQNGATAGYSFYFKPDFAAYKTISSFGNVLNAAAGQTFFSIGLGIGTMLTYSSYMSRDTNLQSTGMTIGLADTAVAVLAGMMVFPLMFSLGLQDLIATDSSVGGLFIIIPTAFSAIGGALGLFLAIGFFIMLTFAALSSAVSLLEVPISYVVDRWPHWGRTRAVLIMGLAVYLLGLPSAIWLDWLDFVDRLVSNVLLLFGGFMLVLYTGWIRPDLLDELKVGIGKTRDFSGLFKGIIRYPLPVLLGVLLLLGIVNFIQGGIGG